MQALVVDDSRAMRAILTRLMIGFGFEVAQAGHGGIVARVVEMEGADQGDGLPAAGRVPQVAARKGDVGGGLEWGKLVGRQGGDQVLPDAFGMKGQGAQQKGQGRQNAHRKPLCRDDAARSHEARPGPSANCGVCKTGGGHTRLPESQ